MSTTRDTGAGGLPEHVAEELPALLTGELDLDAARAVTVHLRACPACRDDLVEIAAGIGLMQRLDRLQEPAPVAAPVERPVVVELEPARRRGARTWTRIAAAAAILLVVAGGVTTALLLGRGGGRGDRGPVARVALAPVSDTPAAGSVSMRASGNAEAMVVNASLPPVPAHRYYEVWLLDRESGKMLPVGVLAPDGSGKYRLAGTLVGRYDSVDISVQPDNGSTAHSSESVLRAKYA